MFPFQSIIEQKMRAPESSTTEPPSSASGFKAGAKKYFFNHISRFANNHEIDHPKQVMASKMQHQPHPLIDDDNAAAAVNAESIEAKWEHLQYFDQYRERWLGVEGIDGHVRTANAAATTADTSYTSLSSSSTSSSGSNSITAGNSRSSKLQKLRKHSWKKIKSQFGVKSSKKANNCPEIEGGKTGGGGGGMMPTIPSGVSTAPDGGGGGASGVIPRIRASKSMQSLEQFTRDGYFSFRDATSNLKERYHSRTELRQAKPKSNYELLWDEDLDEDTIRLKNLAAVGLA